MLTDYDGNPITQMQREEVYLPFCERLGQPAKLAIIEAIHMHMDEHDTFVSGHIPGNDWRGTCYQAIHYACDQDESESGKMFGLMVWDAGMKHPGTWSVRPAASRGDKSPGKIYTKVES